MAPRPRKPWSKTLAVHGVRVRVYERAAGGVLYLASTAADGTVQRKSLKHRDRALAEQQATAVAERLANIRLAGTTPHVTLGEVAILYREHRLPLLKPAWRQRVDAMLKLLERHFGRGFRLDDLSQHAVDGYVVARRDGGLQSARHQLETPGVRDGTIAHELRLLGSVLRWARAFRVRGRPLLAGDPLAGVRLPEEVNRRRPIATVERYDKTLAVADRVEPLGRFRCLLLLARHTGRRINALCQLRAADVLRTRDAVERALGETGQPVAAAQHWPHGALRFRAEHDKKGYDAVAPLSRAAREALDAYLREQPRVGDVPLFPARRDPSKTVHKKLAGYWMRRAEALAKLPALDRGGWHAYRRLFASERRHLPAHDVAAAGGWRSLRVMQEAYQHADAAGVFAVLDQPLAPPPAVGESGVSEAESARSAHTADTPRR